MSNSLVIEGISYISSRRASEITGYSQDYVGQLARGGKIIAKRAGGLWYILEDSILSHKKTAEEYIPVPPNREAHPTAPSDTAMVTFEGKTYVSASRAAKLTSYHQDYIGQLARGGKILSRQVGNRWYIDIDALKEHKKEKDALLGALQSESVGIAKDSKENEGKSLTSVSNIAEEVGLHYTYKKDEKPLIPEISPPEEVPELDGEGKEERVKNIIPIKIMKEPQDGPRVPKIEQKEVANFDRVKSKKPLFFKIFPLFGILIVSLLIFNFSIPNMSLQAVKMPDVVLREFSIKNASIKGIIVSIRGYIQPLFYREIVYSRE